MDKQDKVTRDGLKLASVKPYAEQKHRLLSYYAGVFANAMRNKWDSIVYLDLFSRPGQATVSGSNRIVATSPLLVLGLETKFHRYVFCDANPLNTGALRQRVQQHFASLDVRILDGDVNMITNEIIDELPRPLPNNRVLGFCFMDPFKLKNLRFTTIESLSKRYMDLLILVPSGMDAKRNVKNYSRDDDPTIDLFVGNKSWRERWANQKSQKKDFGDFVVEELIRSMASLGFLGTDLNDTVPVRNEKNVILYKLCFFSRDKLGIKLFKDSKKYSHPQQQLI